MWYKNINYDYLYNNPALELPKVPQEKLEEIYNKNKEKNFYITWRDSQ